MSAKPSPEEKAKRAAEAAEKKRLEAEAQLRDAAAAAEEAEQDGSAVKDLTVPYNRLEDLRIIGENGEQYVLDPMMVRGDFRLRRIL